MAKPTSPVQALADVVLDEPDLADDVYVQRLRRPAPGTVLGGLAVFIVLSGVGYAATGGTLVLRRNKPCSRVP